MKRWIAGLILVSGCVSATPSRAPIAQAEHAERREILVAAGDSLLAMIRDTVLFAADAATAEALGPAARRLARSVAPSPGEVWCSDRTTEGRTVGLTLALAADSATAERAEARWFATCSMNVPGATTPTAFGEFGIYEVIRRDGRWRVTRELLRMAF